MNWQSQRESLYKVWTNRNSNSKFIVVQHGAYVGGIVTDIPHKFTKCDIFLTWGSYFVEQFKAYNSLKKVEIVNFGNPIYNMYDRENFEYKDNNSNKVLIIPTALDKNDILHFYELLKRLKDVGFQVVVKEHNKQGKEKDINDNLKYPSIEGVNKITGELYSILKDNDYDFIISDHSSSLLDTIFFKNKVIYFDPNNNTKGYTTNYSKYLTNLYLNDLNSMNKHSFYELVDLENQELLFGNMITTGTNLIDRL